MERGRRVGRGSGGSLGGDGWGREILLWQDRRRRSRLQVRVGSPPQTEESRLYLWVNGKNLDIV
jgi:hypothetical protein